MKIIVIGSGYVGLVTGVGFAELGSHVSCIDTNQEKINALKKGICPIHEIGLGELIVKTSKAGRLTFDTDAFETQQDTDLILVITPRKRA